MSVIKPCCCPVLTPIVELEKICEKFNIKLSQDTNDYLLKITVRRLGAAYTEKLVRKMVADGVLKYDENEEFEVESVEGHALEGDLDYYLIKWKGWGSLHNSWEPATNLSCPGLIEAYHEWKKAGATSAIMTLAPDVPDVNQLLEQIFKSPLQVTPLKLLNASENQSKKSSRFQGISTSAQRKRFHHLNRNKLKSNTKANKIIKADVQLALKAWARHMNSVSTDPAPIFVENNVDLEGPPSDFEYINDYKAANGVDLRDDPIVGCECTDCISEAKCCPDKAGAMFPYYKWGRVRVGPGCPIYECNRMCKCGTDCLNRVVQKGRRHKVCIFRAKDGRGWGVKTLQKIKKGSFVMEYLGEVITNEEAEKRGKQYDKEGMTYLFDLDYQDQENAFTVDAGYFGNISHFVNHSCDPNLVVYGVWINNLDPRLPRIAFFAKRNIVKGEELTFDYTMNCGDMYNDKETAMEVDGVTSTDVTSNPTDPPSTTHTPTADPTSEKPPPSDGASTDPAPGSPGRQAPDASLCPATPHQRPVGLGASSPRSPADQSFGRRKSTSPGSKHGRIWCLCGAANCKKFIF